MCIKIMIAGLCRVIYFWKVSVWLGCHIIMVRNSTIKKIQRVMLRSVDLDVSGRRFYAHEWRELVTGSEVRKGMIVIIMIILILE